MRIVLGVGLACLLAGLTTQQTDRWRDDQTLWCDAVLAAPAAPRVLNSCALGLMRAGAYGEAVPLLTRAAQVLDQQDPSAPRRPALVAAVRSNLAISYGSLRRTADARAVLRQLDPTDPRTQWLHTWLDP